MRQELEIPAPELSPHAFYVSMGRRACVFIVNEPFR